MRPTKVRLERDAPRWSKDKKVRQFDVPRITRGSVGRVSTRKCAKCHKDSYSSQGEAIDACIRYSFGLPLRAYQCSHGDWHITKKVASSQ